MLDSYRKNDPRGWGGDPSRGAALGRPPICTLKPDYSGYIYIREVVLDDGGYDCLGTYFGAGDTLYWCAVEGEGGELDEIHRAYSGEDLITGLKARFPDSQLCFAQGVIE